MKRPAQHERIQSDPSTAIAIRDLSATHFSYPWHYHPELELTLIVQGRGLRYVGDSIAEFEAGDLCLIGGGTPHCWLSQPVAGKTVRALVIQFPAGVFGDDFLRLAATRPLAGLLERAALGLSIGGPTHAQITAEMWRLTDPAASDLEKIRRLLNILVTMSGTPHTQSLALTSSHPAMHGRDATRLGKLTSYIHDHAMERLSQREAAKLVAMSPGAFSRFFGRHFGKPFVAYVAEVRIAHACRLLIEDDLNISEIAYQVGFNNLANFNRQFLRLKGVAPSGYRKMARRM